MTEDDFKIKEDEYFEVEVYKKGKSPYSIENFTQSQSHGLFWDSEIREKVFGLNACKNDTKKYDIECSENKFDLEENISIKCSSNNNIDCGDILRFYNGDFTNKYTIILLQYEQIGDKKKIKGFIEINYNLELRNYLFGSISEDLIRQYVENIKTIPHGEVSSDIKKKYKDRKNYLQKQFNMKINISPKVDSKAQRRVQCSIPKINELLLLFPELVISRTSDSIIRGIKVTQIIKSPPRIRKQKK
jgi:hypothetical protein